MAQSTGGVATTSRLSLYPMLNLQTGLVGFYAFDPSAGFNDPLADGFYSFRVEDVLPGRVPTIRQAIITYRDLGSVSISLTMTGTTDAQAMITQVTSASLGNAVATGRLMTKIVPLNFPACYLPQLMISRAANAGPLSIVKLVLTGRVEVTQAF